MLTTSVRAKGVEPTTAASAALGVKGFMKAALGVRFFAGAFLTTFFAAFLAGAFFATTFLAGAFFAGAFFATTFLAGAFFAAAFLAGAFLATTFFAGAFFAADFFAAFFAVAIFIFLLEVSETPLAFLAFCRLGYRKGEKPFFSISEATFANENGVFTFSRHFWKVFAFFWLSIFGNTVFYFIIQKINFNLLFVNSYLYFIYKT